MNIQFRVDASAAIGGGHVMRCLTLADHLRSQGASVGFLSARLLPTFRERIKASGHQLRMIAPVEQEFVHNWDSLPMDEDAQLQDASNSIAALDGVPMSWIAVDHYRLGAAWQQAFVSVKPDTRIFVIDDLANRRHHCDLLLDQSFGRDADDYGELIPADARVLAGTDYAVLRPEFAEERIGSISRRADCSVAATLFVFLGTSDVGGITAKLVKPLVQLDNLKNIDVVIARDTSSYVELRELSKRHPRVRLHVDNPPMARLMAVADLAIGAAGSTSWERCCLGLPSITVVLAKNQQMVSETLAAAGACETVADPEAVIAAASALINDGERRLRMSRVAASLVDGKGVERVAAVLDQPRRYS